MPPEIDENRLNNKVKPEAHLNEQILSGVQAQWESEISRILPASAPSESPLTYRRELSKTVHDYLLGDRDFSQLNDRLHKQHALKDNFKIVGLAVYGGLPELVVIDKSKQGPTAGVSALAVSLENGQVTGNFSKDEHNHLRHSAFLERPENQLPIPVFGGGTIWRDLHGAGRIREVDTPQGLKESISYDPRGHVQKLDFMIGERPLVTYQRNEDGSYDSISPQRKVGRGMVDNIEVTDDRSINSGEIVFSMHGGRMTKWMRPNGQVRAIY